MSSKSKGQKGAFGGLRSKRRKAQMRFLAERQIVYKAVKKELTAASLPGSRLKIKEDEDDT